MQRIKLLQPANVKDKDWLKSIIVDRTYYSTRTCLKVKYVLAPGEYQRHRISNLLATNIVQIFACFNFCFNVLKANI